VGKLESIASTSWTFIAAWPTYLYALAT